MTTALKAPPKCSCEKPREYADPRRKGWCCVCLRQLDPAWLSTDQTVGAFLDRLRDSIPGIAGPEFDAFRAQCVARERAGREKFGLDYLGRDNLGESMEEFSDGSNYFFFDYLEAIRRHGEDYEIDLVLTGAWHAYQAHQVAQQLRSKRRGAP